MSLLLLLGGKPAAAQAGGQIFALQCDDDLLFYDQPDLLRIPPASRTDSVSRIQPPIVQTRRRGAWLGSVPLFRHPGAAAAAGPQITVLTLDDNLLLDEAFVKAQQAEIPDAPQLSDGLTKSLGFSFDDNLLSTDDLVKLVSKVSADLVETADLLASVRTVGILSSDNLLSTDDLVKTLVDTLAEQFSPDDIASAFKAIGISADDNLLFTDALVKSQQTTQQDQADAVDALTKSISSTITETVEAADTFQGDVTVPTIVARATAFARISTLNPYTRRRGAWLGTVPVSRTLLPIAAQAQLFTLSCDDDLISSDTTACQHGRILDDAADLSDSVDSLRAGRLLSQIATDTLDITDTSDASVAGGRRTAFARISPASPRIANSYRNKRRGGAWLGTVPVSRTLLPLAPTGIINTLTIDDFLLFFDQLTKAQASSVNDFFLLFEQLADSIAATIGESVFLTDQADKSQASVIADPLWLADTASAFKSFGLSFDDFILLYETLTRAQQAIPGDSILFSEEIVEALTQLFGDRVELVDSASANKVAGVSAADTLLLVTDLLVKQLQTAHADSADLTDALAIILRRVLDDNQASDEQFIKELLKRIDADRAELSDMALVSRVLTALFQDNLALRDEMVRNLGIVIGDDFASTETLVKVVARIILEDAHLSDDIVAAIEIAVVHIAEYLAKSAVDISNLARAKAAAAPIGNAPAPEVGARQKVVAAPVGDNPVPKVGARQKVRK